MSDPYYVVKMLGRYMLGQFDEENDPGTTSRLSKAWKFPDRAAAEAYIKAWSNPDNCPGGGLQAEYHACTMRPVKVRRG